MPSRRPVAVLLLALLVQAVPARAQKSIDTAVKMTLNGVAGPTVELPIIIVNLCEWAQRVDISTNAELLFSRHVDNDIKQSTKKMPVTVNGRKSPDHPKYESDMWTEWRVWVQPHDKIVQVMTFDGLEYTKEGMTQLIGHVIISHEETTRNNKKCLRDSTFVDPSAYAEDPAALKYVSETERAKKRFPEQPFVLEQVTMATPTSTAYNPPAVPTPKPVEVGLGFIDSGAPVDPQWQSVIGDLGKVFAIAEREPGPGWRRAIGDLAAWLGLDVPLLAQMPAPRISFVATGRSTGEVFEMQVENAEGLPRDIRFPDALVMQPVKGAMRAASERTASTTKTLPVTGYCLDFVKAPPAPGTRYQLAPPDLRLKHVPASKILSAASDIARAGKLHPDSDPGTYGDFVRQWSIWTRVEQWDKAAFTTHYLDRTKKNVEGLGQKWTPAVENQVKDTVANRWKDIEAVLAASAR